MEKYVLDAIERFSLLENAKRVTVALSGGADSMSLLHILLTLKDELNIEINAAHLNHMIRGEEAERDENFVKEQCEKLGVELFCERVDVLQYAKNNRLSTELAARTLRYDFLERVAIQGLVATAHTASDNLETVIFNLSRGSAIDGLCGIPPKREIFIRPLILCTREDVEEYCEKNNVSYVTDSTNLKDDYSRNKIRHNIVPILKELNPSVERTVLRTTDALRDDAEFLDRLANDFLADRILDNSSLSLDGFDLLNYPIAKRVIKKFIEKAVPEIKLETVHLREVMKSVASKSRVSLPKNYSAVVSSGKLFIKPNSDCSQTKCKYVVNITEKENDFFAENKKINNLLLNSLIDCDKIVGKLVVRTRMSGDNIRLLNRGCTKSLYKLYNECDIPLEERDLLPVISDDNGVIWIFGIGVAQRCAVTTKTKRVLVVNVEKENQ